MIIFCQEVMFIKQNTSFKDIKVFLFDIFLHYIFTIGIFEDNCEVIYN